MFSELMTKISRKLAQSVGSAPDAINVIGRKKAVYCHFFVLTQWKNNVKIEKRWKMAKEAQGWAERPVILIHKLESNSKYSAYESIRLEVFRWCQPQLLNSLESGDMICWTQLISLTAQRYDAEELYIFVFFSATVVWKVKVWNGTCWFIARYRGVGSKGWRGGTMTIRTTQVAGFIGLLSGVRLKMACSRQIAVFSYM